MKRTTGFTLIFIISCLLSVFPAFAGDWQQTEEDEWQYIQDDGSKATGWLKLDGNYFYFDSDGIRNEDRWIKDKGSWYYLDEEGVLATDQWVDNYYVDAQGKMKKKR
jgi:glucan-binding YG repeat protein